MDLTIEDDPDPFETALLDDRVRSETIATSGRGEPVDLAVLLRDGGVVRAGLCGWTWGGCCELESLWVEPSLRGRGVATRLLAAAESVAMARGCGQVVLFTHAFQAPGFYERRGYELVGRVEDYPAGTAALWFRKMLRIDATQGRAGATEAVSPSTDRTGALRDPRRPGSPTPSRGRRQA